jgi:3,4-dihydroxy-9,10-secoandrosta-1,3,5(10)-triene-9,17-dione 4,5-dioxygenase
MDKKRQVIPMAHIRGLGYLRVQTRDLERWKTLLFDVLGFARGSGPDDDTVYARMDERRARLSVAPGDVDQVQAVGWEVRDQFALRALVEDVEAAGTAVKWLSPREAEALGVEEVVTFADPSGIPLEVFHSPILDHSPLITPFANRFVTGDQGMGHVVLPTTALDETMAFYQQVLGFLPRGAFAIGAAGDEPAPRVRFLGINQRHHSLAIVPAFNDDEPGLVHLMVEVEELDDVGRALDRVHKHEFSISSTLGRHTNDKMVSFYVRAPGGWDIEYGCEGMRVDERHYSAEEMTADSYWGHDWSGSEPLAAFVPPES